MKKIITTGLLAFAFFVTNASNDLTKTSALASDIARRMANQVELNEMEYIQVKKYTIEKLSRVANINDLYSNDVEMLTRKIMEEEAIYNHKIMCLLSARQLETYAALKNSFKTGFTSIAETE